MIFISPLGIQSRGVITIIQWFLNVVGFSSFSTTKGESLPEYFLLKVSASSALPLTVYWVVLLSDFCSTDQFLTPRSSFLTSSLLSPRTALSKVRLASYETSFPGLRCIAVLVFLVSSGTSNVKGTSPLMI